MKVFETCDVSKMMVFLCKQLGHVPLKRCLWENRGSQFVMVKDGVASRTERSWLW